jgi:hypothetical protein
VAVVLLARPLAGCGPTGGTVAVAGIDLQFRARL